MSEQISELTYRAHKIAVEHGFWLGHNPNDPIVVLAKLALIASEVGEAVEATRDSALRYKFGEELADIVIRVFDLAEASSINLEREIINKIVKNENRPMMHGKLA